MTAKEVLEYLQCEIHSVIAATVDEESLPVTCAIDMMDADENGLYFLTARGKNFYDRLKKRGYRIDFTFIPAVIRQDHCLYCGNCMNVCPQNAVIREG